MLVQNGGDTTTAINNDSFNPLLGASNASINSSMKSINSSRENLDVALLSVKPRSNSDPTHKNKKFDSTANLPNLQHTHFATGLVPVLGDEIAHGMQRPHHKSTLQQADGNRMLAVFILCSVSLGVGVFVLPSILLLTGIGTGILMLAFYAVLALYTQLIVLECADRNKSKGYEQMAATSMGRLGEFLLAFFMAISLLTGNCGHIQTVGQLLHDIIDWFYTGQYEQYSFDWAKTAILYSVMLSLTLPWLFQRSLHGLSGVGTLSVVTVIITSVSLCIVCFLKIADGHGASDEHGNAPDYGFDRLTDPEFWKTDFWRACPTMAFVYTPILELFPVYTELNHRDAGLTRPSVYIATFACFVIYVVVSVTVVVTFGTDTEQNSLYNIPSDNYWITFCCFTLVIVITLLYPVINYPMLNAIETILDLFGCCNSRSFDMTEDDMMEEAYHDPVNTNTATQKIRNKTMNVDITEVSLIYTLITPSIWLDYIVYHRRDIISVLSIFVVIGVDIGVTDLDDLFGLCGSLGLSFVCYIFPCMIWITAKWQWNELSFLSAKFWWTIFVLLFSAAVMVYSTVVIILNILKGN